MNLFLYIYFILILYVDDASEYEYLMSECKIPGVDDEKCFEETITALTTLRFSKTDKMDIFYILSGILFLGNIKISDNTRGSHSESDASFIKVIAKFLSSII